MKLIRLAIQWLSLLLQITRLPTSPSKQKDAYTNGHVPEFEFRRLEDLPHFQDLRSNTVYLVGENDYIWLAAFKCPCGCGEVIQLNLLSNSRPSWKIRIDGIYISITPSVERIVGCKSHFSLTEGQIIWWPNYHY